MPFPFRSQTGEGMDELVERISEFVAQRDGHRGSASSRARAICWPACIAKVLSARFVTATISQCRRHDPESRPGSICPISRAAGFPTRRDRGRSLHRPSNSRATDAGSISLTAQDVSEAVFPIGSRRRRPQPGRHHSRCSARRAARCKGPAAGSPRWRTRDCWTGPDPQEHEVRRLQRIVLPVVIRDEQRSVSVVQLERWIGQRVRHTRHSLGSAQCRAGRPCPCRPAPSMKPAITTLSPCA